MRRPLEMGSGMAGVRMRTVVVVSLFIHLLILSIVSETGGIIGYDKKKDYISVDIILNSRAFNQAQPAAKTRSVTQHEAQPRELKKTENIAETDMSMTPQIAPLTAFGPMETAGAPAGPALTYAITDYQSVHRISKLPLFRKQVTPEYPISERNAGKEARIVVEVYINVNGAVDEVKLIKSGGAAFDEAVIKSVKASSFEPGYMDGKQVAVRMQIPYVFKLR